MATLFLDRREMSPTDLLNLRRANPGSTFAPLPDSPPPTGLPPGGGAAAPAGAPPGASGSNPFLNPPRVLSSSEYESFIGPLPSGTLAPQTSPGFPQPAFQPSGTMTERSGGERDEETGEYPSFQVDTGQWGYLSQSFGPNVAQRILSVSGRNPELNNLTAAQFGELAGLIQGGADDAFIRTYVTGKSAENAGLTTTIEAGQKQAGDLYGLAGQIDQRTQEALAPFNQLRDDIQAQFEGLPQIIADQQRELHTLITRTFGARQTELATSTAGTGFGQSAFVSQLHEANRGRALEAEIAGNAEINRNAQQWESILTDQLIRVGDRESAIRTASTAAFAGLAREAIGLANQGVITQEDATRFHELLYSANALEEDKAFAEEQTNPSSLDWFNDTIQSLITQVGTQAASGLGIPGVVGLGILGAVGNLLFGNQEEAA